MTKPVGGIARCEICGSLYDDGFATEHTNFHDYIYHQANRLTETIDWVKGLLTKLAKLFSK